LGRRRERASNRSSTPTTSSDRASTEAFATEFVLKLLKKRLFSSPEAFRLTLEKHEASLREGKKRTPSRTGKRTLGLLRREIEGAEEDAADDELYEERNLEAVETTSTVFRALSAEEQGLLRDMKE